MIAIFIEAGHKNTAEYTFMAALLSLMGYGDDQYEIITVGGKDNLPGMRPKMLANMAEGVRNIVIFDADSAGNGGGCERRRSELTEALSGLGVEAELFLFPDNTSDGDFETLLLQIARQDLHKVFFDCFGDFESCVRRDYVAPNLKGKLHTYVSSQKWLSNKQRDRLGRGDWLFDVHDLWDMDSDRLSSLKDFIRANLQDLL